MQRPIAQLIPTVPEDLTLPVSALVRSAVRLREAFVCLAQGFQVDEVIDNYGDHLELANRVIDTWIVHLELDEELDTAK